jgi:hypothetical protein
MAPSAMCCHSRVGFHALPCCCNDLDSVQWQYQWEEQRDR